MKIDRLIGILSTLLQHDRVSAPYLAEKFEVSRRTIQRDVDALCRAGIPLSTSQGAGGGISIMQGYKLDHTLLTSQDAQALIAGLRSLDSVTGGGSCARLMEKLGLSTLWERQGPVLIDLASWYKGPLSEKLSLLQASIEQPRLVSFCYCTPGGEGSRTVEPYYIVYQWAGWYLYGWCLQRQDFRLFKLLRMTDLAPGQPFRPRPAPPPDLSADRVFPTRYQVQALVPAHYKWRLIEEYGPASFTLQPDGRCLADIGFTHLGSAVEWMLGFRGEAQLLGPPEVAEALLAIGRRLTGNGPST
ncbi:helix-turn-helix transcriptional regulator [Acutalibacter caecimuris]|uniref:helix-turn-helix transcriptional regulator n=1 Tax=Acutalibacter caecimuris TaxID=3093657 RepID=UPI002AC97F60|nr:YafY family protein [Acutalibacter sp. M00118]